MTLSELLLFASVSSLVNSVINDSAYYRGLLGQLNELIHVECLESCLTHSRRLYKCLLLLLLFVISHSRLLTLSDVLIILYYNKFR